MTEYRLKKIKKEFPTTNITLNTSQYTFKFYEKFGFSVTKIIKDGYYHGLDKYDMVKINSRE
jgi:ribosomal protein S18 acetylase RimI-like enzyme